MEDENLKQLMQDVLGGPKEKSVQQVHAQNTAAVIFAKRKRDALRAARELGYSHEIIDRLHNATTPGEINCILATGRHQMYDGNAQEVLMRRKEIVSLQRKNRKAHNGEQSL